MRWRPLIVVVLCEVHVVDRQSRGERVSAVHFAERAMIGQESRYQWRPEEVVVYESRQEA